MDLPAVLDLREPRLDFESHTVGKLQTGVDAVHPHLAAMLPIHGAIRQTARRKVFRRFGGACGPADRADDRDEEQPRKGDAALVEKTDHERFCLPER
ncbi:hypothetical protein GCM10009550_25600 [Actinocorallia libanotica]|uniref:Uncharacterized protein n=1 Tax=Actinocorallia libanotica TaxID=46162 RepID=A0ABN1QYB0_9ACTN